MEEIIKNYTFNPDLRTIRLTDFTTVYLERLLLITDVTRNIVLYDADNPTLSATASGNTFTLAYKMSTSNFSASDRLRIIYNPSSTDPVDHPPAPATNDYPYSATPITSSSGNKANTDAVATLAGASGKTTYITGFVIAGGGATLGSLVGATITGVKGGTMTFPVAVIAGVLLGIQSLIVNFAKPIPASTTNTDIVVTLPALGVGNTNAAVVATGYQL